MAKAFDATTKQLVEAHPADWLAYAGLPAGDSIRIVDADLSSFSFAADKVIRLATKKFGPPDSNALFTLHAITDVDRIEFLAERLLDARSWEELLRG
jgi:hypothetical protein